MKNNSEFGYSQEPFREDFDLLLYVRTLRANWMKYFLAGVVGGIAVAVFYLLTIPPPQSYVRLDLGFGSITSGTYPDGTIFNRNDLVSTAVVSEAKNRISELTSSAQWTTAKLSSSLSVKEVYPLELQLIKEQLTGKGTGMKPEEVSLNYQRLMKYNPTQFDITFAPNPSMPLALQRKVLEMIIAEYSDLVIKTHVMPSRDNLSVEPFAARDGVYSETLDYLEDTTEKLGRRIDSLSMKYIEESAKSPSVTGGDENVRKENLDVGFSEAGMALSTALYGIREELVLLESLIYDRRAVADVDGLKRNLETKINAMELRAEMLEKQVQFRLALAKLPISAYTGKKSLHATVDQIPVPEGQDFSDAKSNQTLMGVLLSYNKQYYNLMKEAEGLYDEKVNVLKVLEIVQNRLKRLQKSSGESRDKKALFAEADEMVHKIKEHISSLSSKVLAAQKKEFIRTQPPVQSFVITEKSFSVPYRNVVLFSVAVVILSAVAHLIFRTLGSRIAEEEKRILNINHDSRKEG